MEGIAKLPDPPYYAVIFIARRTPIDEGYSETATRMETLATQQPGFLGIESVEQSDGLEVTISYWRDEQSIFEWKHNLEHLEAQRLGREKWYEVLKIRVARVERAYGFAVKPLRASR
jgi:heme-degrading monooxygenase HmoA